MSAPSPRRAFTLIETLIVVLIMSTLAAVVTPQFTNAREEALDTTIRSQLKHLRKQIAIYNNMFYDDKYEASEPLATFWDKLTESDLLLQLPINPYQTSSTVAHAPASGVGWVWSLDADSTPGSLNLWAVDINGNLYVE